MHPIVPFRLKRGRTMGTTERKKKKMMTMSSSPLLRRTTPLVGRTRNRPCLAWMYVLQREAGARGLQSLGPDQKKALKMGRQRGGGPGTLAKPGFPLHQLQSSKWLSPSGHSIQLHLADTSSDLVKFLIYVSKFSDSGPLLRADVLRPSRAIHEDNASGSAPLGKPTIEAPTSES